MTLKPHPNGFLYSVTSTHYGEVFRSRIKAEAWASEMKIKTGEAFTITRTGRGKHVTWGA